MPGKKSSAFKLKSMTKLPAKSKSVGFGRTAGEQGFGEQLLTKKRRAASSSL
jgi:hypothetical protein